MKSICRFLLLGQLTLLSAAAVGQRCQYCDQLKASDEKSFMGIGFDYSPGKAQALVDQFGRHFRRYLTIVAKPDNCDGPHPALAIICGPQDNLKLRVEGRYIFYKTAFLDSVQKASSGRGDRFVLAHEVAHHALGHTVRIRFVDNKNQEQQTFVNAPTLQQIRLMPAHLHELEADALGLWIALRNGLQPADIDAVFRALPVLLHKNMTQEITSHPSLAMRKRLIDRLISPLALATYLGRRTAMRQPGKGADAELDSAEVAPYIHDLTEGAYAFELMAARDSADSQFTAQEWAQRRILDRMHRFSVEVVGGGQVQQPALSVGAESVAAAGIANGFAGVRVGWQPWYGRHRLETDLLYNPHLFTTQDRFGNSWRTVETFRTTYLHLRPRYVRQLSLRQAGLGTVSRLWVATAGGSVALPLRFRYENAGLSTYQSPRQRVGFAPVVGIGFGQANPEKRFGGHWRLTLLYQWQWLNFTPVVADSRIQASMHTLSLDLSLRLW